MRRLDRYILTETLGPLALGFLIYTFIMLIRFLFRSAEMIIRRGLAASEVGELVLLTLPNILVLTIPMALLFGILIAIGRLASDSELVAMRATGLSLFGLYRPILFLSVVLTLVNTFLAAYVLPRANHALQVKQLEILAQTASRQVEPRVFYEQWEGFLLYVFEVTHDGTEWRDVFLAPASPQGESTVTTADVGRLRIDPTGERIVLTLENAATHKVDSRRPDNYQIIRHRELDVVLDDRFTSSQREKVSVSKGVRELTLTELQQWVDDPDRSPQLRRLAKVEIHKKFAIPAACLVFGLFAVPLGFNNRRGGKSSGFALSIGVILVYYILISNGEDAATVGKLPPWLAMWLPNILLSALGTFFLARRNRDKSLLLHNVDRWIRLHWAGRVAIMQRQLKRRRELKKRVKRRASRRRRAQVVVRVPRISLRFPNLLDRYILRLFGRVLFLVSLSGLSIYIIADITENAGSILEHKPGAAVVASYYAYLSLQVFFEIAPILVLITTLMTFTLLSRSNEVTAAKALGISLYRMALPAVIFAGVVSASCAILQAEVLPASNQRVAALKDVMKGRAGSRTYRRADRQWTFGQGDHIFNYLFINPTDNSIRDLQVFQLDENRDIQRRLYTEQAHYQDGRWTLSRGWLRDFDDSFETVYRSFEEPIPSPFTEPPDYFLTETRRPEQMSLRELELYIRELEASGQSVPELRVELHNKVAFPALSLVMALVGLPFAFRLQRTRGAMYGIGLSLVLGMVMLGVFAFFTTLGEAGALPPVAAVWAPSVIFASFSLYLFLGVRT